MSGPVAGAWSCPGYDVEQLIGFGATGEVWRARDLASGETVALKRLRPGVDRAAVAALRREAGALALLDTPHVIRLRGVVGNDDDPVLVLDHAAGGSLGALLSRRGCLTPGEVVTVAAPLAQALAAAHARGLVHGDVTPANVLFRGDGMPLLSDLGVARLAGDRLADVDGTAEYVDPAVARGGLPDAAADVWSLAAVCHHLLAGSPPHDGESAAAVLQAAASGGRAPLGLLAPSAPRALVAAVEAALVADPAARPDAAAFAASLRRAHATAPVRLHGGSGGAPEAERATHLVRRGPSPAHATVRRRRPPRGLVVGLAALTGLLLAGTAGWASGREVPPVPALAAVDAPAPVPAPRQEPPPVAAPAQEPDWAVLVQQLTVARADALVTGAADRLAEVYAPGSPVLAEDRARLVALAQRGLRADGVRHDVRSVEVLSEQSGTVRLRVVDELSGYVLRDPAGAVAEQVAGRPAAAYVVELVEGPAGWRIAAVEPG